MDAHSLALLLVLLAVAPSPQHRYVVTWAMESRGYPDDGSGRDFLAVFDVADTPQFGQLVAMLAVPGHAMMAHHANYWMPPDHRLWANDFMADRSYIFDVSNPLEPRLSSSFTDAGPYTHPHSFAYLSNGHTLATYQTEGSSYDKTGALIELDDKGRVLRTSAASAPTVDQNIRPYSVLVIEKLDRVVTTSAPMPSYKLDPPSHVVQIWRLSDLKLLETIDLPKPTRDPDARDNPDEARLLADGTTVLVKTVGCALYRISDLGRPSPRAQFVYDFGYRGCPSVPVVVGNYWVQPCTSGHSIVALDVRDPSHPVQTGYLSFESGRPHWLALERGTGNLVITGYGSMLNHVYFAKVDLGNGALTLDPRTIDFDRKWPDGWDGPAVPHAAVFY